MDNKLRTFTPRNIADVDYESGQATFKVIFTAMKLNETKNYNHFIL